MTRTAIAITFVVILAGGGLVIWLICRPKHIRQPSERQRQQSAPDAKANAAKNDQPRTTVPEPRTQIQPSVTQTDHAEKQRQKCIECVKRSAEIAGLIVAIAYVIFTYGLWQEAQKQSTASTEALHITQRPWVSASGVEITKIYDVNMSDNPDGHFDVDVAISLKNTGLSTATEAAQMTYLYPGYSGNQLTFASALGAGVTSGTLVAPWTGVPRKATAVGEIWDKECRDADEYAANASKRDPAESGFVIAPGASTRYFETVPNNGVTLQDMTTHHLMVLGCIAYQDGFAKRHHTRYCFLGRGGSDSDPSVKAMLEDCARIESAD